MCSATLDLFIQNLQNSVTIQHYCTLHFYEWTGFSASQKSQSLRVKGWIRSLTTRMSNSYGDVWLLDTHYGALQQTYSITIFPPQHIWGKKIKQTAVVTCAGTADDAVVNDGAAVDGDLQTVMSVVMLSWFVIRIELK